MAKNRFYNQFLQCELTKGFAYMDLELIGAEKWIINLYELAKKDFIKGKFSYDGSTFGTERNKHTIFEVASFIHDWLNGIGIVSYAADTLMLRIMLKLDYQWYLLAWRGFLTRFTFINILRHKYNGTYKGKLPVEIIGG